MEPRRISSPFYDAVRVANCQHGPWVEEWPDAFGDQTCAKCETKVRRILTPLQAKTTMNQIRPGTFPEVD